MSTITINEAELRANKFHSGGLTPQGYQQITTLSSAVGLAPPTGATLVIINPEGQSVRWRDDGTDPTASLGLSLSVGDYFTYTGDLGTIKFIEEAVSATLNLSYYG